MKSNENAVLLLKNSLYSTCRQELIYQVFSATISIMKQETLIELITGFSLASLFYFQIIFFRNT